MKFKTKLFSTVILLAILVIASIFLVSTLASAQVKLRVFTVWGGVQKEYLDQMFAEYTKSKPGVEIIHESMAGTGAGTYTEVLETGMASGTGPDVFFEWGGELAGFFIDAGYVEPMEPYWKKYNWDKIIIPWAKKAITRKGTVWGAPICSMGMSFWYRVDLWKKLGLTEPKTYAEVEALCDKVKGAGIYPLSLAGKYGWMVMRLVDYLLEVSCGPELHDQLNALTASWNRPEVIRAYTMFKKWVDKGWIIPGFMAVSPDDARMPMYQGKALMVFEGTWMETVFKSDEQDVNNFDFFVHPTDHKPLRVSGFPEQYMISKACKYKDAAAEFINWYIQPETQKKYLGTALASTATIGVYPDPKELPSTVKWRKILEQLEGVFPPTDQAFAPELMHYYFEVQDALVGGQMTPVEGAKRMQGAIEDWKAKKK